ncbi:MAG: BON domain-containing protein [Betaproteobacteria bacterium]
MIRYFTGAGNVVLAVALAAGAGAMTLTGCSSTATHRSTSEYADDATISTKIKTAFARDETVKLMNIEVETYRGVVQLSGFADSDAERTRAVQLAEAVSGVKEVKNDIRLKP